jgi:hypothetical protein
MEALMQLWIKTAQERVSHEMAMKAKALTSTTCLVAHVPLRPCENGQASLPNIIFQENDVV